MAKATARGVANFFLEKGFEEGRPIDQLKLQKLVYYAFAWFVANNMDELFEDIYAWPHGPVVRELWHEFKDFGRNEINRLAFENNYNSGTKCVASVNDATVRDFLGHVWEKYKGFSGIQLSNMTHDENEPWHAIRLNASLEPRPRIPTDLIKEKFRAKLGK